MVRITTSKILLRLMVTPPSPALVRRSLMLWPREVAAVMETPTLSTLWGLGTTTMGAIQQTTTVCFAR